MIRKKYSVISSCGDIETKLTVFFSFWMFSVFHLSDLTSSN